MDDKQLGYKLKQFREEAGLSQQEIAEKLEISFELNYNYLQPNIIISSVNQFLREI